VEGRKGNLTELKNMLEYKKEDGKQHTRRTGKSLTKKDKKPPKKRGVKEKETKD